MERIKQLNISNWHADCTDEMRKEAIEALESGQVLYLPQLPFMVHDHEQGLLTDKIAKPGYKNICYNSQKNRVAGTSVRGKERRELTRFLHRFSALSWDLMLNLLPSYVPHLQRARTSFRPVEVKGRDSSYRKDDTRLHVDSFSATPTGGKRILRVFSNVNPDGVTRHWRLGEAFSDVANRFLPKIPKPNPFSALSLQLFRLTKSYRTPYDHYMLNIHDAMKWDMDYQKQVDQQDFHFASGSTWIVYSDQASHAAMSGQFMFEQSFYLPVEGMKNPNQSPLKILEKAIGRRLV